MLELHWQVPNQVYFSLQLKNVFFISLSVSLLPCFQCAHPWPNKEKWLTEYVIKGFSYYCVLDKQINWRKTCNCPNKNTPFLCLNGFCQTVWLQLYFLLVPVKYQIRALVFLESYQQRSIHYHVFIYDKQLAGYFSSIIKLSSTYPYWTLGKHNFTVCFVCISQCNHEKGQTFFIKIHRSVFYTISNI